MAYFWQRVRFRFGLRTMLLAVFVAAVFCALYLRPCFQQKAAVAAIQARGGRCFYEDSDGNEVSAEMLTPDPIHAQIVALTGPDFVYNIVAVELSDVPVLIGDMESLRRLPKLRRVRLGNLSDDLFPRLAEIRGITHLDLSRNWLSVKRVDLLSQLPKLERLAVDSELSDEVVDELPKLPALRTLDLSNGGQSSQQVLRLIRQLQGKASVVQGKIED